MYSDTKNHLKNLLAILLFMGLSSSALGGVATCNTGDWTGNTSSDWNDTTNWCNNTLPHDTVVNIRIHPDSANPVIDSFSAFEPTQVNIAGGTLLIKDTLPFSDSTMNKRLAITDTGKVVFNEDSGAYVDPVSLEMKGGYFHTNSANGLSGFDSVNLYVDSNRAHRITVEYAGSFNGAPQPIRATEYENLIISGEGTKRAMGDLTVRGDLTITDTAQFDANGHTIELEGDWTDTSYASSPDPFEEGGSRVVFNGDSTQTISATKYPIGSNPSRTTETFYAFEVNKDSSKLVLDTLTDLQVGNALDMKSGILEARMNNSMVTATSGASSNGGNPSSFVNGTVTKTGNSAFTFPIGYDSTWARIGIDATENSEIVTFEASYMDTVYYDTSTVGMDTATGSNLYAVDTMEHWTLNRTAGSDSARVTLYFEDPSKTLFEPDTGQYRVARYDGSKWVNEGGNPITFTYSYNGQVGGYLTSMPVKNFSPFTIGAGTGKSFSLGQKEREFARSGKSLEVFPNPAADHQTINVMLQGFGRDEQVDIRVQDMLGKQFHSKTVTTNGSEQRVTLDGDKELPTGIYIVSASSKDEVHRSKLIIE